MQDNKKIISALESLNPGLEIHCVLDKEFLKFGNVINDVDFTPYVEHLISKTPIPQSGAVYVASDAEIEKLSPTTWVRQKLFGNMDIQIGYCNGTSKTLNALEYHKCNEFNVAATDLVLLVAHLCDIVENSIDSSKVVAFFVPKGTAIDMFSTTLHFAPCATKISGFSCLVGLAKNTNEDLAINLISSKITKTPEEKLLFKKNKWLIAHADSPQAKNAGAFVGITGKNIELIIS